MNWCDLQHYRCQYHCPRIYISVSHMACIWCIHMRVACIWCIHMRVACIYYIRMNSVYVYDCISLRDGNCISQQNDENIGNNHT